MTNLLRLRAPLLLGVLASLGCSDATETAPQAGVAARSSVAPPDKPTLSDAREGFVTHLVSEGQPGAPPDDPADDPQHGNAFKLISYKSPVGDLAAYVTPNPGKGDPGDGARHPAIVWITGGDCNSIGDVWTPQPRANDQSASAFRKAGVVMMFPSLRGANDNPGRREGFLGEVDDVLAAADHLATLPYVDPQQIYLGGHSTGGTLAMLVAESDAPPPGKKQGRFRATFALGPVAAASQYGGQFIYCDPNDKQELALRSPLFWLDSVRSPLYVFEGLDGGNWQAAELMHEENTNPLVRFYPVPGHDHFSVIAPLTELLAGQVAAGEVEVTEGMVVGLE